jgi:hypothetical protein
LCMNNNVQWSSSLFSPPIIPTPRFTKNNFKLELLSQIVAESPKPNPSTHVNNVNNKNDKIRNMNSSVEEDIEITNNDNANMYGTLTMNNNNNSNNVHTSNNNRKGKNAESCNFQLGKHE